MTATSKRRLKKACAVLCVVPWAALWVASSGDARAADQLAAHRLDHVTAYPTAAVTTRPITVDGDLGEWRAEAFQTIFQDPDSRDLRACRFALAYGDEGLFVAMDVTDDSPLQNEINPLGDPFRGWRGDAMQMRFQTPNGKFSHWTWWQFTERELPAVDVRHGTDFTEPVTLTGADSRLKYAARPGGYTFELLMPWDLLRARADAGASWRTVVEPHFSIFADEVAAFSDCITREENAMYKRPHLWGELRFASAVDAAARLAEQVAVERKRDRMGRADAPSWGLPVPVINPAEGFMSLAITDAAGRSVRTLLAKARRPRGEATEYWDGLDDDGNAVAPGRYRVKALTHPGITPRFVTSVMNAGTPPWITADGRGSWGGDHGNPVSAAAGPDGQAFLLWTSGEAGFALIGVDAEGRKQWGYKLPFGGHYIAVAYDGGRVYTASSGGILVNNASTGGSTTFPGDRVDLKVGDWPNAGSGVAGLAAGPEALYVSVAKPGKIIALDKKSFAPVKSWDLPGAGHLAYDAARKRLYAVAAGRVHAVDPAGEAPPRPFITEGLDAATGIAVDGQGRVYVACQGDRQCVVVHDTEGRPLRTIGKEGGRPRIGRYDQAGMLRPAGICIDTRDRLWVAEDDAMPRRISQWNAASGEFLREFFGAAAYAVMMAADPEKPEHVYLHNCRFIVDYDAGTSRPDATIYRAGTGPSPLPGSEAGYGFMGATFTISRFAGKPFASNGHGGVFAWGDAEFAPLLKVEGKGNNVFQFGGTFFPDATLIRDRKLFQPRGLSPSGAPDYPTAAEAPPIVTGTGPMTKYSNWMDVWPSLASGWSDYYAIASLPDTKFGGIPDGGGGDGIFRFNRAGDILWRYPNVKVFYAIKDQRLAGPGDLMGAVRIAGEAAMPPEQGGEIVCIGCYRGYYGLLSDDGLFIDKISEDKGKGLPPGFDTFFIENFSGFFFKHPRTGKVYLFCGDVDARILEIQGLENVRRFDGGTVELTAAEATRLAAARAANHDAEPAGPTTLRIAHVAGPPAADAAAFPAAAMQRIELDEKASAAVGLCADDAHLYTLYRVDDPSPWKNGATDWKMVFKGGDAVDLQLGRADGTGVVRLFVAPHGTAGDAVAVAMWPQTPAGMPASPETYESPVGRESFGRVAKLAGIAPQLARTPSGYVLVVAVPWAELGMKPPAKGEQLRGDMGVLFSDPSGSRTIRRRYLFNTETAIVDDVPSEVRLAPQRWGGIEVGSP
jgi:hypothetical protein